MFGSALLRSLLLTACAGTALALADVAEATYADRPLQEALLDLRARGLRIVFTSNVVTPEMLVESEPAASDPRAILDELLRPHGLTSRDGPGRTVVVVPVAAASSEEAPALSAFAEELVVTPSRISLLRERPVGRFELSRDEILALPHLGDDFFRALTLLPGATANDISARFHVRGGRRDETLMLLDGQELYEPFHLQDFDSALSFVAPATLGSADLHTGGFSAQYGDRMSGVLDMTTLTPSGAPRVRVGAGTLGGHLGSSGVLPGERGAWLVEARRGSTDLVGKLLSVEEPRHWDAFTKLDFHLGTGSSLRANALHSADYMGFEEIEEDEHKRYGTSYRSSYGWLTQQSIFGENLVVESSGSWVRMERRRSGEELEDTVDFEVRDVRETDVFGLRQGWTLEATPKHLLQWGWQLRRFDTAFDYSGSFDFVTPLAQIRHDAGEGPTIFRGRFEEEHHNLYLVDRMLLLDPLTLELGVRYDRHSLTRESLWSPRLNLAYAVGDASVLRFAWGRFNQSQRPYELQVEDGETAFHSIERSMHHVLGFERVFDRGGRWQGLALRAELYRREVRNPRPRFENLFEPFNVFPELEPDRVRIAPQRSVAEGLEIFLRGRFGAKASWWINYDYATTEDVIEGIRVLRAFDQRHSLKLDLDWRLNERWRLNTAWRYNSGWPTTPLALQQVAGEGGEIEWVPILGRLNSERLRPYHRLDLRASHRWTWGPASTELFVDIQNVYDRQNIGGFDYELEEDEGILLRAAEKWPGILPSIGISFEF